MRLLMLGHWVLNIIGAVTVVRQHLIADNNELFGIAK